MDEIFAKKKRTSVQKVIIDTDLDSDVDDVGALSMLLNLHKKGQIELLGVIVTSDDPYAPVCASALNTFYGFTSIPIGFNKNQPNLRNHSKYTKSIADFFPSGLQSWNDAEDAVSLYRNLLVQQPNESVIIVTIGHLSNLEKLLQSAPDQISDLDGKSLVREKVKKWVCMGGKFPQGKEANFFRPDPESTVYSVNNWEKEVIFCGYEVGSKVITGGTRLKKALTSNHPVYLAYELYNGFEGRQSWDQIAVLLLLNPANDFFTFARGKCIVNPDGSNSWKYNESGLHRYVVFKPTVQVDSVSKYVDRLMAGKR